MNKSNNSNLNNSNYRDFLMKNTNSIMKQNCQNPILNQVRVESMKIKTYPCHHRNKQMGHHRYCMSNRKF